MSTQTVSTQKPALDLTDFLSSARYAYKATLLLGLGATLEITYRAADPARAKSAILAAAGEEMTALGFVPDVLLSAVSGRAPKGESAAAFTQSVDALDTAGTERLKSALMLADGAAVADVVGSAVGIAEGGERTSPQEITPAFCAALPGDVTRAILQLASAAQAPADALDFLGRSR